MIKRATAVMLSVIGGVVFLVFGADISAGIRSGVSICGEVVIPSLFPFMILSEFIALSGAADMLSRPLGPFAKRVFGLKKSAAAPIFLSFISGYPVGASLAKKLYDGGKITRNDAEKMLTFTVNSSPAMIIFAVGAGMLGSKEYGYLLLTVHITASVINGILFSRILLKPAYKKGKKRKNSDRENKNSISPFKKGAVHYNIADAFVNATADASVSMLKICGCVILFAGIVSILDSRSIFAMIFEVTVGCKAAVGNGINMVAAVLGFGGISVIMQVMTVSDGLIRPQILVLSRLTHAAISYGLCSAAIRLIPERTVAVLSTGLPQLNGFSSVTAPASAALLLLSAVVMFSAKIADSKVL